MGIKMAEPLPQEIAFHVSRMLSIVMPKLFRLRAELRRPMEDPMELQRRTKLRTGG